MEFLDEMSALSNTEEQKINIKIASFPYAYNEHMEK